MNFGKNFITNSETSSLKERLTKLVPDSKELKFLVGFFYFSGIRELYLSLKKTLEKNPAFVLKILVGLNVDRLNYQIIEYSNLYDKKVVTDYDLMK